jgi:protein-L-isoaspartate(D-aspartate) O-methyltransferase
MTERTSIYDDLKNEELLANFYRNRYDSQIIYPVVSENPLLIRAFANVDRAHFLPDSHESPLDAYEDKIISLKERSTISQPSLVASMLQQLDVDGTGRGLEIGTASGYNAAVMAQCMDDVVTIEYEKDLAESAKEKLVSHGVNNVDVITGDGLEGYSEKAPFDRIIVTAGLRNIPQTLADQLADGGVMIAPVGRKHPNMQQLLRIQKTQGKFMYRVIEPVRFVPAVSDLPGGWRQEDMNKIKENQIAYIESSGIKFDTFIASLAAVHTIEVSEDLVNYVLSSFPFPDSIYDQ